MMQTLAQGKGMVLTAHVAPQTPFHLHGDARHLRQVLINLVGNAIKFTERGRVDVYVRPTGQSHPQRLRFEIVDTGIGIPEAAQARIFDSFTQADPSVTRRFGGSGLGTTIAKQLVETLGGQIGLHSREGESTTFRFELPCPAGCPDPCIRRTLRRTDADRHPGGERTCVPPPDGHSRLGGRNRDGGQHQPACRRTVRQCVGRNACGRGGGGTQRATG
ncbi:MAG TPA: ATP-binding protein [Thiobacillus sp.]|jgi:hypothetical protein|nr:ATP-binding protein [Thiobacillus sp.]